VVYQSSMPTRIITFDCYGTLVDWETGIKTYAAALLKRKGSELTADEFFRRWEEHQRALLSPYRGYRDLAARAVERLLRDLKLPVAHEDGPGLADSIPTWHPFADVPAALRRLGKTYRLHVISNMDNVVLFESVSRLGAPVHGRTSAEDAKAYKPDPAIFRAALATLGAPPEDILHVASSWRYDLATARGLGLKVALLRRGASDGGDERADLEVASMTELADRLLGPATAST
jgi:2-haloacid dehalogenase